jgi:hypothetical protein
MNKSLYKKILVVATLSLYIVGSAIVFAAATDSTTFTTSLTTTGVDFGPPTVPADLTATSTSPTQVDLSWSPSVGNLYGVSGYRVFRDSINIATTTTTSYFDTTVLPSTNYTYEVDAFNSIASSSGLSLPVSVTTLSIPTLIPEAGNYVTSGSGSAMFKLFNVVIEPDTNSAKVSFETNLPTRAKLFWGLTAELEKVSLSGLFYENTHELKITGLVPMTNYHLRVQVTDFMGRSGYIDYMFTTTGAAFLTALPNPSDFKAIGYSDHVGLSWINPNDSRFTKVRIVRSDTFFPRDQYDGAPIYEGSASRFDDRNVVAGKKYYYAIFSESANGTFSSGALAQAEVSPEGGAATNVNGNPFVNIEKSTQLDPMIDALKLSNFQFIQDGKVIALIDNTIYIDAGKNLTLKLDYALVPEILKNIIFAISDPTDASKVFTFLLRVNKDKSAFEATIGPLNQSAKYGLHVMVLDFQNKGLKQISGSLMASLYNNSVKIGSSIDWLAILLIILIAIIILVIAYLVNRMEKKYYRGMPSSPAASVKLLVILLLASSSFFLAYFVTHAAVSDSGLVGYWSFDEGAGTIAHDFSGKGNNGTIYGSTSWVDGKLSKALNFDGTSYAYVPASASLNPTSGSITVTVWLKDSGISQSGGCAHMVYDPGVFGITSTCGSVWINEPTSGTRMYVSTTGLFDINKWTNVALTYDKTTGNVIVYKNGTQFISQNVLSPGTSIYPTSTGVYVGGVGLNSPYNGNGQIDETRIYNRALSATDVSELYQRGAAKFTNSPSNNGLVGYWSLDEGTSTIAHDFSGNGNNGTLNGFANPPTTTSGWNNGRLGKGLSFDGTGDYLTLPGNTDISLKNNISSVSMWAYINSVGPNGYAELYSVTGGARTGIVWRSTQIGVDANSDFYDYYVSGTLSYNSWNHIVVEIDRTINKASVYINGVYKGQTNAWSSYTPTANTPQIGANSLTGNGGDYLNGKIDEVRIYNRALSATEVSNLYKLGAVKLGTTEQASNFMSNGLVGYWPFNGKDINWTSGTTGTAYDRSGNGNNGTLTNMNQSSSPVAGKIGQALSFNGVNNVIQMNNVNLNTAASAFNTISFWMKWDGTTNVALLTWGNFYDIWIPSSTCMGFNAGQGDAYGINPTSISNKWSYVTLIIYNGAYTGNNKIYINGNDQILSQCSGSGQSQTSGTTLYLGNLANGYWFNGTIDEVRIYNRALSAAEVKGLYLYGQTVIKH